MSNPLLPLFKEQLEAECAKLAEQFDLALRGQLLIYWYFTRLYDLTDTEIEEILCDGGGDLGIDAIWIDDDIVHFYQFKNPRDPNSGFPSGDVDKTISGLRVILQKRHDKIANPELKARIDEIYQQVPKGYQVHFVTSGEGLSHEAEVKLDALINEFRGPSSSILSWDEQPLSSLQERFYRQTLPSVKDPLKFDVSGMPYLRRSGVADSYQFHIPGDILADLYEIHGELLLQRNIRVDQRDTVTNRAIEATSAGDDAANFLHYNNGVTFLCETAQFDPFQHTLTLTKAQVVNGGQTIRALHRAQERGSLKTEVEVAARAITSSGDREFANNVAVNLNNQNQVGTGFLRSNDPRVVQLERTLASQGWYLERREGELRSATADEIASIQARIGQSLNDSLETRTIPLKEGAQAYTATFYEQPEMAKKNPKRIFESVEDGGQYEKIFSADMTAEKIVVAFQIKNFVDDFVRKFATVRRKVVASGDPKTAYEPLLGDKLANTHGDVIHQVMAQCSMFLCGTLYKDLVTIQKIDFTQIPDLLSKHGVELIREHLYLIIDFAKTHKEKADRSWPVLLKNNTFFTHIVAYLTGIRKGSSSGSSEQGLFGA